MDLNQIYTDIKELVERSKQLLENANSPGPLVYDNGYLEQIRDMVRNQRKLHKASTENDDFSDTFDEIGETKKTLAIWWQHYQRGVGLDWPNAVLEDVQAYNTKHPDAMFTDYTRIKGAEGQLANEVAYRFQPYDLATYENFMHAWSHYLDAFKNTIETSGDNLISIQFQMFVCQMVPVIFYCLKFESQYGSM